MQAIYLFSKGFLWGFIEENDKRMFNEINEIEGGQLQKIDVSKLCDYLEDKYRLDIPKLLEDRIQVDQKEIEKLVGNSKSKGTCVTYYVPFEGDVRLLHYQPTSFTHNKPCAIIERGELKFAYEVLNYDTDSVNSNFQRQLSMIRSYLDSVKNDLEPYNDSIRGKASSRITSRIDKLKNDNNMIMTIGYPLRKRENPPNTFTLPKKRQVIPFPKPTITKDAIIPEPTLEMKIYEEILDIIRNMSTVMERSPEAFKKMSEENIRQHFLVQLNGQYEGRATGETFNSEGKTDILVRVEGRNVFIAECKFWTGPESLTKAVNQLLGYTCWRDTKTAILLFNRNRDLSSVLQKISDVIRKHPNFKREIAMNRTTEFRYILHHKDDKERDIVVSILVFEVPE